jgi:hypothetical protein
MIRRFIMMAGLAASLSTAPAIAKDRTWPADQIGQETSIPFIGTVGLYNFEADSDHGVWLQDQQRRWYYARLMPSCINLSTAIRIGVDTRFNGSSLDRTGALLVDGQRCVLTSLTKSDGPPPKVKKPKKG